MAKSAPKVSPRITASNAALLERYPHITKVVKVGAAGNTTRVVIRCTNEGCAETREIATQDAFQVKRCPPCQREVAKARRRKTPVEAVEAVKARKPARKRSKRAAKKAA